MLLHWQLSRLACIINTKYSASAARLSAPLSSSRDSTTQLLSLLCTASTPNLSKCATFLHAICHRCLRTVCKLARVVCAVTKPPAISDRTVLMQWVCSCSSSHVAAHGDSPTLSFSRFLPAKSAAPQQHASQTYERHSGPVPQSAYARLCCC